MQSVTITRSVPVKGSYDLVVCGGGLAGVAAALQAARLGKRALLIEKSQKLGGLGTLGLINFFVPMCNGRGRQIIFGMAEEFLRLSIRNGYDTIPADWQDPDSPSRYVTRYSPEIFAMELTRLLRDEGVELMFDTLVTDALYENGVCSGVVVENKSGKACYRGKIFVEATGDCDLLQRIGIPVLKRGNYHTYLAQMITLDSCRRAADTQNIRNAIVGISGGTVNLYGTNQPEDIALYDGTDAAEVNRYLVGNQIELLEKLEKTDRLSREPVTLPGMPQFRTTACMDADYALRNEDAYRHFDDSIAAINDFDRRDFLYEVPYRTMIRSDVKNIIAVGRCACGEGYGWDVLRVIPPAIITGQAAGFAACQAIDKGCTLNEVDVPALQAQLEAANVLVHFDDAWVPALREDVHTSKHINIEDGMNT